MNAAFYLMGFLLLLLAGYAGLWAGIMIGRNQEYVRRSEPLLGALKMIGDFTMPYDTSERASKDTIHTIAEKNFSAYHPNPPKR